MQSSPPRGRKDVLRTSVFQQIARASGAMVEMFSRSSACTSWPASKNTHDAAPRLSASMPIVPTPANTSATRAPGMNAASRSNVICRTRSVYGRVESSEGVFSRRRRYFPEMMRRVMERTIAGSSRNCKRATWLFAAVSTQARHTAHRPPESSQCGRCRRLCTCRQVNT